MHASNHDSGKVAVAALVALALTVAISLLLQFQVNGQDRQTTTGTSVTSDAPVAADTPVTDSEDAAGIRLQQQQAEHAARESVGQQEFEQPPETRPAFVSPLEWQVLQQVSRNHDNPRQELTRLVNRLRFAKLRELWEAQVQAGNEQQSRQLGNQLLEDLPSRVKNREITPVQAQQLQASILEVLIDDPQQRRQRAAEEARHLGITFEIQNAG